MFVAIDRPGNVFSLAATRLTTRQHHRHFELGLCPSLLSEEILAEVHTISSSAYTKTLIDSQQLIPRILPYHMSVS